MPKTQSSVTPLWLETVLPCSEEVFCKLRVLHLSSAKCRRKEASHLTGEQNSVRERGLIETRGHV